jgi:hypothetical protein
LLKQEVQLKTCMPCCRGELWQGGMWNKYHAFQNVSCLWVLRREPSTWLESTSEISNPNTAQTVAYLLWISECRLFEIFVLADCCDWRTHRRPKLLQLQRHLRCRRGIPTNTGHAPPKQQCDLFHLPTFTSEWMQKQNALDIPVVEADPKPSERGQPCTRWIW